MSLTPNEAFNPLDEWEIKDRDGKMYQPRGLEMPPVGSNYFLMVKEKDGDGHVIFCPTYVERLEWIRKDI